MLLCESHQATSALFLIYLSIAAVGAAQCLMSAAEWNNVVSADKDAPSWLQVIIFISD